VSRALLDRPMAHADATVRAAFEAYAKRRAEKATGGLRARTRELVATELRSGTVSMVSAARSMGMSAPTLRRRLEEEDTSFTLIIEEVRRELADRYLRDRSLTISQISDLLGFAHPTAFHKAFRRWTGITPSAHRARGVSSLLPVAAPAEAEAEAHAATGT
jgi:AraC-like DNA-binding protein